ncbi:hypothetical protein E3E23_09435 [Thermococcus sp. CX2]|uniref:hypothetical protein n=1 Tax=Thermococcus sp. CX2 TaxID=163006 RepID=UPI00143B77E8|nr:hypothetical protein [Thermococcus sp. CX2]NJE86041.1 hypothetical protein [Thermococcus sp. CX2]
MKIRELIELLDETIANVKIALVANQQRSFESPHTSYEFTQRALELEEDLGDLEKVREYLSKFDPEDEAEEHFSKEEIERLVELLELLQKVDAHLY